MDTQAMTPTFNHQNPNPTPNLANHQTPNQKSGVRSMLRSPLASMWAALAGGLMLGASGATADVLTVALDGSGDHTTIQDAIDASADGDTILVGPGVYVERIDLMGREIIIRGEQGPQLTYIDPQGSTGEVVNATSTETTATVIRDLTIRDATGNGGCGIFIGSDAALTVQNVRILNCQNENGNGGGIVVVENGSLVLRDSLVSGCHAQGGGAMRVSDSAQVELIDSAFETNWARNDNSEGGAIYAYNAASISADGCVFRDNDCNGINAHGGAISTRDSVNLTLVNCRFEENYLDRGSDYSSAHGGAVSVYGPTTIESCVFLNNRITNPYSGGDGYGGALWVADGSPINVSNSTFEGNYVRTRDNCRGGAVYGSSGTFVGTFADCIFRANRVDGNEDQGAEHGGAVFLRDGASPTFTRCDFIGNLATDSGGAFYLDNNSTNPVFDQCRFEGNRAEDEGGAIYSYYAQPFIFNNCYFGDNTSNGSGGAIRAIGADSRYPDIGQTEFCGNLRTNSDPDIVEHTSGVPETSFGPGVTFYDNCAGDCNGNGVRDDVDIELGLETDCDGDFVPDSCQIVDGAADCDEDGLLDICEFDCDQNGIPDDCDVADGGVQDCNANGIPDACDITDGGDLNNDGVVDDCQPLDFTGVEVEIAPITGVIRGEGSLMPLSAVCYRIYATFDDPGAHLIGLFGSPKTGSMVFTSGGGLYQDPDGGDLASDRPCDPTGMFPELAFDSLLTVGGDCASDSFEQNVGVDFSGFNTTGSMVEADGIVLVNPDDVQGTPDAEGRVLVAQLTSLDGSIPDGRFNLIGTNADGSDFQAFQVSWEDPVLVDCNDNGVQDALDIGNGSSLDCNLDGIPDECQTDDPYRDCNDNGTPDWCDISTGVSVDVNNNGIPDECECEGDLNGDGLVNVDDIIIVILNWGEIGKNLGDANNDGQVDGQDLGLVITAFGGCFG